jgi:hypothetical protein
LVKLKIKNTKLKNIAKKLDKKIKEEEAQKLNILNNENNNQILKG